MARKYGSWKTLNTNIKVRAFLDITTSSATSTFTVTLYNGYQVQTTKRSGSTKHVVEYDDLAAIIYDNKNYTYINGNYVGRRFTDGTSETNTYGPYGPRTHTYNKTTSAQSITITQKVAGMITAENVNSGSTLAKTNMQEWSVVSDAITIPALPSYKVTYNGNGGQLTRNLAKGQTKYYGQQLRLLADKPTTPNLFEFIGWNTNKNATTSQYSPNAIYNNNSSLNLFAIYKQQKTYAQCITDYNTSNAITTVLNQNYLYTPTKIPVNKRFLGWYKNPESLEPQTFLPDATTESTGASLYINASKAVTNSTAYSTMDKFVAVYADNTPTTYLPESYEAIHPEITSAGAAVDFQTYINAIMAGDDYEQIDSDDSYHSLFGYIKYNQDTGLLYNDQITVTDLTTQSIYSTNIQKIGNYVFWKSEDPSLTTSHQYRVDFSARDNNRRLVTHSYVIKKKSKLIDISPGSLDINADAVVTQLSSYNPNRHIDLTLEHKTVAPGLKVAPRITLANIGTGDRGIYLNKKNLTTETSDSGWLIRVDSNGILHELYDYDGSILSYFTDGGIVNGTQTKIEGASLTVANAIRRGNLVHLYITVKNNNAVAGGANWYVGTLNNTAWRPQNTYSAGFGVGYYGNRSTVGCLNGAGVLVVRNAAYSSKGAKGANEDDHMCSLTITYVID